MISLAFLRKKPKTENEPPVVHPTSAAPTTPSLDPAARLWSLRSLDSEVSFTIDGQYPIELKLTRPSRTDSPNTSGPQAPVMLSAGTGQAVIACSTEFRSLDNQDDLGPLLARWRALQAVDPRLGRHVRVRLEAPGVSIEGKAIDIDIDVGTAWPTGLIRYFRVSFKVAEDGGGQLRLELEAPTVHETQHVYIVAMETYEHLARRLLGDPAKGPLIRYINPTVPDESIVLEHHGEGEEPSVQVRVFERDHPLMRRSVRPMSIALGAREDFPEAFTARVSELARERAALGSAALSSTDLRAAGYGQIADLLG